MQPPPIHTLSAESVSNTPPHTTKPLILPPQPLLHPNTLSAKTLYSTTGLRLYDPGLAHTLTCKSSLTRIDGLHSLLSHRGYPIQQLAAHGSYLELLFLLLYKSLPCKSQLHHFTRTLYAPHNTRIGHTTRRVILSFEPVAHPMAVLMAAIAALGAEEPALNPALVGLNVYAKGARGRERAMFRMLGVMPVLVAAIFRHTRGVEPVFVEWNGDELAGMGERFWGMCWGGEGESAVRFGAVVETLMLVHMEHELNCSTATVRGVSSAGGDLFSCVVSGVAALYGVLHGGATEGVVRMLEEVKEVGVTQFLDRVKRGQGRLMGFGHRVYKSYDPRARIVKSLVRKVYEKAQGGLLEVAEELERVALADDYFVKRRLFPNCDFYSGVVYGALGFDKTFFTVLFALSRVGGWVAHWNEFLDDPDRRIFRPHQVYTGVVGPLEVTPIEDREDAAEGPKGDRRTLSKL